MTDRLRIPVPFGADMGSEAAVEEAQLVDNRVRVLEQGWQAWEKLSWQAVTVDPAIGNGNLIGRVRFDERWLEGWVELTAGTTTTFGTGVWFFEGAPVPAAPPNAWTSTIGWGGAFDTSASATYAGPVQLSSAGAVLPRVPNYGGSNGAVSGFTSTVPFTWASGDSLQLYFKFRYRD